MWPGLPMRITIILKKSLLTNFRLRIWSVIYQIYFKFVLFCMIYINQIVDRIGIVDCIFNQMIDRTRQVDCIFNQYRSTTHFVFENTHLVNNSKQFLMN